MKDYFPHSAFEEFETNPPFIEALWKATEHITKISPIFVSDKVQAYSLTGLEKWDYLVINDLLSTFVVVTHKNTKLKNELKLLSQGYTTPVYFDLNLIKFTNQALEGNEAIDYLIDLGQHSKISNHFLFSHEENIEVKKGELLSMNVHLDILSQWVKALQFHELFPQGDIDYELKQIGFKVALKNETEDFLPVMKNILTNLNTLNITEKNYINYNDGSGKIYLGTTKNSFIIEEKLHVGLVVHLLGNTWNVYSYFPLGQYTKPQEIFNIINHDNVHIVQDLYAQFNHESLTYVGGSLLNLHLDLESANYFISREIEKKLKQSD